VGGVNDPIAHLGLLDDEEIQIEVAALELSALDHDGVDLDPYLALLAAMEEKLASIAGDALDGVEQGRALAHVIGVEYGFTGDRASYDAPLNADMIRVIDRRKGLPVSLSILYAGLGRRLGWQADALNTPGHVVVSLASEEKPTIIDPFSGGRPLTRDGLSALIAHATDPVGFPDELHLSAMTNRMTLTRLLINQALRAEQSGDTGRALTLYGRMTVVAPGDGKGWWELARLQLAAGERTEARTSLTSMLEITKMGEQRANILATLEAIA
jgi:regulator of sirC expression with transglutaminase-like and TPR domain